MRTKSLDLLVSMMLLAAIVMTWSRAVHASLEVLEQAFELTREQIISLPRNDTGRLSIRPCADCEAVVLRVSAGTRYFVDRDKTAIGLRNWLAEEAGADDETKLIYVFYRPKDKTVSRIVLDKD